MLVTLPLAALPLGDSLLYNTNPTHCTRLPQHPRGLKHDFDMSGRNRLGSIRFGSGLFEHSSVPGPLGDPCRATAAERSPAS